MAMKGAMDNGLSDVPLLVITDDWLERNWFWDSHLSESLSEGLSDLPLLTW